ncbi:GNAT family N-acetyltransferase [Microlunatus soli]|uniref:Predicted acetyltransferase n=1 Tax=Microlunatus soli TaxID=630515 RepID=A0A1H1NMC2_9ACTN|nr:GNAT family N-acetyltransferase [Microlunatus soli]SDS00033.1 Predicted acetyltransferase [Microlunatus soli]
MPVLVRPDVRFHRSFLAALQEGLALEEEMSAAYLFTGDQTTLADPQVFADYVEKLLADVREETPRPEHFVPGTALWWVDGTQFLGRIAIRHRLNDWLRNGGGHIGYWIRPSVRRRGHARAAFLAGLSHAHRLGIDPALVSCDDDNIGSRKVIESAGGVFERPFDGKLLYWVPTGTSTEQGHNGS